ncbi:hypothetical protein [Acinetobacter sp. RW6]|uniref:hypothetical protein n=1 Tax=Acinetobacter sp. RW6 TaxID=3242680 RepID=UPI0035C24DF1
MENIFSDYLVNSPRGKLYIPDGLGPFPSVIILKQYEEKINEPSLDYYAKKMNEIGFLAFTFISIPEKQIEILYSHLNSAIDYLTNRSDVDTKKIFLLMADREKTIEINMHLFSDRIHAIASLSWLT